MPANPVSQPDFTTLFGDEVPPPATEPASAQDSDDRYANVRAHIELGIKLYGNRSVFAKAIGTASGTSATG